MKEEIKKAVEKKTLEIISKCLAISEGEIKLTDTFLGNLKAEDLDLMNLLSQIRMTFFNIKDGNVCSTEELHKEAKEKGLSAFGFPEKVYLKRWKGVPGRWMKTAFELLGEKIYTVGNLVEWIYELIFPFIMNRMEKEFNREKKSRWDMIGKKEEAVHIIVEVTQEQAFDIADYFGAKGQEHLNNGKFEEAISFFDKAIFINPWHADSWLDKGVCLKNLRRFIEAIYCYEEVCILQPGSTIANDALYNQSLIYIELKRYDEALDHLDLLLLGNPYDAEAWLLKGGIHAHFGESNEAIQSFQRAVRLKPELRQKLPPELQYLI